jgi:Sel1 repeat
MCAAWVVAGGLLFAQAVDLTSLRRQAEAGNSEAQFKLAEAYYGFLKVSGISSDPTQGLEWLQKSALRGYPPAESALGVMLENGQGLAKNPHEAAHWFRKAAKQQNEKAQAHLAAMLAQGLISQQEANWRVAESSNGTRPNATAKAKSFSAAEIETGLSGGITNKRMIALVDTYGVDFRLNTDTKKKLTDLGADDTLLAAISASKR